MKNVFLTLLIFFVLPLQVLNVFNLFLFINLSFCFSLPSKVKQFRLINVCLSVSYDLHVNATHQSLIRIHCQSQFERLRGEVLFKRQKKVYANNEKKLFVHVFVCLCVVREVSACLISFLMSSVFRGKSKSNEKRNFFDPK